MYLYNHRNQITPFIKSNDYLYFIQRWLGAFAEQNEKCAQQLCNMFPNHNFTSQCLMNNIGYLLHNALDMVQEIFALSQAKA